MAFGDMEATFMHNLDVNFNETWSAIGEPLQNELLRGSFQYLGFVCDYSNYHQGIYTMVLGIFQNLVLDAGNPAWELFQQFILDGSLPVSGRNNALWLVLGLIGQLLLHPVHNALVCDCIFMLLKNMTTGLPLDQVSLNISYFENLDVNSAVKQPGIGFFAILGAYWTLIWPTCCRQLQRLMDEEGGLLKTIKLLIGFFDYRHCEELITENTQECEDLVADIGRRAGENMTLNVGPYVHWIQQVYMVDNNDDGYTSI